MTRVLVTRAAPEAWATARRLAAEGFEPVVAPMLEIVYLAYPDLALDDAQALLFTSVNGVRAFAAASDRRDLRVLCVGEATAQAARKAGFKDALSADGDSTALETLAKAALDPRKGAVMHASGAEVAGDLTAGLARAGFTARRAVVYRALAADALPAGAMDRLGAALFHSPRGASVFADLVHDAGAAESVRGADALCLSAAVAAAAEALPWRTIRVAQTPREDALLALLGSEG